MHTLGTAFVRSVVHRYARAGRPGHRGFRDRSTTVTMVAPACPPSASQTGERSGLRAGLAATLLALRRVVAERAAAATAPARTKLPPSRCGRRWLRVARETLALWDNVFPARHVLARGGKRHLVSRGATRSATNCKGSAPQIFSCGRSRGGEPDTLTWCVLPHPCAGCCASRLPSHLCSGCKRRHGASGRLLQRCERRMPRLVRLSLAGCGAWVQVRSRGLQGWVDLQVCRPAHGRQPRPHVLTRSLPATARS